MKKITLILMALFLLIGCLGIFEDKDSLTGSWALSSLELRILINYEEGYETQTKEFYPAFDDYLSAPILQIEENAFSVYANYVSAPIYGMVGIGVTTGVENDSLHISVGELSDLIDIVSIDTLSLAYLINENDELELKYVINDNNLDIPAISIQFVFSRYTGDLPPDSWGAPIENDLYETLDNSVDTSNIATKEVQERTLTVDDVDVLKFMTAEDTTYTVQVNANMNVNVTLCDSLGNILMEDNNADSLEANIKSLLTWRAGYAGPHYLYVDGNAGYYEIQVNEDEMSALIFAKSSVSRIDANNNINTMIDSRDEFEKLFTEKGLAAWKSFLRGDQFQESK